ncbi:MAG: 1-deoxy-D-xylulose-5-phosphate reductoisomerase, partial [Lachnospiraceae bacterium]|nr:1-deoxy-D-xylulose-5-phosphate reductoisomerase [Lachnospiraceae bacterium]
STLVNKGLEVIEAKWLFDVELDQIQVVVHPQSIIHSMVQFKDGGVIAQLGTPDMKLPIQYALFYPERMPMEGKRVDFYQLANMTFEKPDISNFEGLALAYEAARVGGSMPTIYNAANERAVSLFLDRQISYLGIVDLIKEAMKQHRVIEKPDLDQILQTEQEAYQFINKKIGK